MFRKRVFACCAASVAVFGAFLLWGERLTGLLQTFFAQQEVASFLLYLETGRVVHTPGPLPETQPEAETSEPLQTAAPTERPEQQPICLTAEAAATIDIRNSSGFTVDAVQLLLKPLEWDLTGEGPKVLILHTHATESYTPSGENTYVASSYYRTLEEEDNMLRIGQKLKALLEAEGISVIQDTTLHDYPSYTGSYANARRTLDRYLEEYPGLCLVLDLHRDALETESGRQLGVSVTVEGRSVAQLMLVVGTDAGGLYHPNWQENLSLALKLQQQLETACPGICRYISLRPERFNQDLLPGAVLVEVGAAGNTLEEALAAVEILAQAITELSKGTVTADSAD